MITSSQNPKIQRVRALLARHKDRVEAQSFVVEGVRLVEEALQAGFHPRQIFFTSQCSERGRTLLSTPAVKSSEIEEITPALMESISGTEAPQGLLAVLPLKSLAMPDALDFVVIADGLRDPGNLGTLLRTAAAAGVQAVLLPPNTTDAFAPKVVRAGMGAHFRLPVVAMDWDHIQQVVKNRPQPLKVCLAESGSGKLYWQADLRPPLAVLVGGEAEGASPAGLALADEKLTIPMPGGSESLNAAVASGILIFEVIRQRYS